MAETPYGIPSSGATVTKAPTSQGNIVPPNGAKACFVTCTTQNVWMTFDGSTPSATNGLTLIAGAQPIFLPLALTLTVLNATSGGVVNVCWLQ